jgi:hypothetical protein
MTAPPARTPPNLPRILEVRGRRVILDSDLASLYGVSTRRLNEQVRRNPGRFPANFGFQLSRDEWDDLKSQFATSSWGGRRKLPYAFTEHGALMAASVLNSEHAIEVSVYVVEAFIAMREAAAHTRELARRLDELERSLGARLAHHDQAISEILGAIRALMTPAPTKARPIGFVRPKDD